MSTVKVIETGKELTEMDANPEQLRLPQVSEGMVISAADAAPWNPWKCWSIS